MIKLLLFLFVPGLAVAQPVCDLAQMDWQRTGPPVLRDAIPDENYEVASDPHVWVDENGTWHMVYSGDENGRIAIRYAKGVSISEWAPAQTLLGQDWPRYKETPFYRVSDTGEHQIYFIGYDDESTYQASVYLAVSDRVSGPYTIVPEPVVPRGLLAGKEVYLITSPSVVSHDGLLHIAFLAWNGFEDVSEVWVLGATSTDEGRSWQDVREVEVPIGMEGQLTPHPSGGYVATQTASFGTNEEGIGIACADQPFGPYSSSTSPVLRSAGAPWELDEIIAPQVTFDHGTDMPVLFYTGADHAKGWWIMSATPVAK